MSLAISAALASGKLSTLRVPSLTVKSKVLVDASNVQPTATPSPTGTPAPTPTPTPSDTTAPITTGLVTTQRSGVALFGSAIPVAVSFTGTDEVGGSGVAHYELEKSVDGGATWLPINLNMATPATSLTVATAGTIQFHARTIDVAGNASDWVAGPVISPRLVQNTSRNPKLTWYKTWTVKAKSAYSGGSVRYATARKASVTVQTSGRSFSFVTTKGAAYGYADIYVNGVLKKRVNLHASKTAYRQVVWSTSWAGAAPKIRIVVEGTARHPRVDLDAFGILK